MQTSTLNPLGLFLHAHINGAREAERCLGVVEKMLLRSPHDGLLLGCKAALLLVVQTEGGLTKNDTLYRRSSLDMVDLALQQATPEVALQVQVMNGLAWARLGFSDKGREHALTFLRVLEKPYQADHIPPLVALEGLVALSVAYENEGMQSESKERFLDACEIDKELAGSRYEFFRAFGQSR